MQVDKTARPPKKAIIALGSNLSGISESPVEILSRSLGLLSGESLALTDKSSWYVSPAFPAGSGPEFVNAVVEVETGLLAEQVLAALHRIEAELGRVRQGRWTARVCDLDLLDFDGQVTADFAHWCDLPLAQQMAQTPMQMVLPHPRIQDRAFVLKPLAEIRPGWVHPVSGVTAQEMLEHLPDDMRNSVVKLSTK